MRARVLLAAMLVVLVTAMGPGGLAALGQMVDLEMTWGVYDFQDDQTIILGEGQRDGVTWGVWVLWRHGLPVRVLLHSPRAGI